VGARAAGEPVLETQGRGKADIVRRTFERWNRGDRELREDDIDPEAEVVSQLANQVFRGYDGIRRWIADVLDSFDEWGMEISDCRETGSDGLLVIGRAHLRGRESGVDLDVPCAWLFDFRDGRMSRMEIFLNRVDEALAVVSGAAAGR
jgi:ketosteroid isomerase-like protein